MIEITDKPISPEAVIARAKNDSSGCVATYVGLIRNLSYGKPVRHVEYQDEDGQAASRLEVIANEAKRKWPVENVAVTHRIGKLKVGDINLVIAIAAGHRGEGFAACQYVVDQFKARVPTQKSEVYTDGTTLEVRPH